LTLLEGRFQPAPAPLLTLTTGMAKQGYWRLPTQVTLSDGAVLNSEEGETPESFAQRVRVLPWTHRPAAGR
jgi:hypothetical protein